MIGGKTSCEKMSHFYITKLIMCAIISVTFCDEFTFPEGFLFGTGSSAHQVEGAWNLGGKSESNWDYYFHKYPWIVKDGSNADVACDSYHKYKEDVRIIRGTGFDVYRFSISWSRVLPTGFSDHINQEGLQYYKNLTRELLDNGIQPLVTLYHWDHPQVLEEMGGWYNESMIDRFVDYARVIFRELGPMVKIFTTINELGVSCNSEVLQLDFKYGNRSTDLKSRSCAETMLKAHAKVYHLYDEEFRPTQHGEIGVSVDSHSFIPLNSDDPKDVEAAEIAFQTYCGWILHAIWIGDYPELLKGKRIVLTQYIQGSDEVEYETLFDASNLTTQWIQYIKGTSDYLGLMHYHPFTVDFESKTSEQVRIAMNQIHDDKVDASDLSKVLRRIKKEYDNPRIIVLENGMKDFGELEDHDRIEYYNASLTTVLEANNRDKCNVIGFCIWSLMDNFEWQSGYTRKFGIYSVDFASPNLTRTAKLSAKWWKQVLVTRDLNAVDTRSFIGSNRTVFVEDSDVTGSSSVATRLSVYLISICCTCSLIKSYVMAIALH